MENGLNSSINNLGEVIAELVVPGLESGDPEREESASKLVTAYRELCESFAQEHLSTQAKPELLSRADTLANEILMAASMQTEIGIDPLLEAVSDAMELPAAGMKRLIRELSVNLAALSVASTIFGPEDFQQVCSGVIQEKLSSQGYGEV